MTAGLSGYRVKTMLLLIALTGIVCGTYSPADLVVSCDAVINCLSVKEAMPGQIFNYNISIDNIDISNDALDVVVMDKLPHHLVFIDAAAYPPIPEDYSVQKTGDLFIIRFDKLPKASSRYVNITVKAPEKAPATLYNIVKIRCANDRDSGNNIAINSIYIPLSGYNKTAAVKSFEDLLHNQSQLLFGFSDLLHEIPKDASENYTFMASFEQLLRAQANLTHSFEELLSNPNECGWDSSFSKEDRTYLLNSYETMLRDEAYLFATFEVKITDAWQSLNGYTAPGHSMDAQWEFLASLEDLLKTQVILYERFERLLKKIDIDSEPQEREDLINFLASFEDLLRVEANLIMSFEDLLSLKFGQRGDCWKEYSRIQAMQERGKDYPDCLGYDSCLF